MRDFLPYGRQCIGNDDIAAVVDVLKSDWLTTGPKVGEFEKAFARFTGAEHAVAVSSGTAALHAAMFAIGIGPGDEVIVPSLTFAASANCVVFQQGRPIFCDVQDDALLIDPALIEEKITPRTRAIIAVDYAGQPCHYDELRAIADRHGLVLVADACHAMGATYKAHRVGTLADLSTFSFHPVKHITTGEGGMITTDNPDFAKRMRAFRNHGISTDHRQRAERGTWYYEMTDLGYNYRITDFQCALGMSQLRNLDSWVARRQEIAAHYDEAFADVQVVEPLVCRADRTHAYHLYVIRLKLESLNSDRKAIFAALREAGIGANVHYIPVHLHPFYREHFGTGVGLCPKAEAAYEKILSLPMFPALTNNDVDRITVAVKEAADL